MAAELPLEIIQKIQQYLDEKQAGQTVVLSKSWYDAWSTLPTLYLNENRSPDFLNSARETVKRYKDSKLYVNQLVITLINSSLTDELIMDALNLSSKELVFTIKKHYHPLYVLPAQLFVASSLTKLHVCYCKINNSKTFFPRLKSLSLTSVSVTDEIFRGVLLGCPLLENLFLRRSYNLCTVNVSKMQNLVNLSIYNWNINVVFDYPEGVAEFPYLRTLDLKLARLSKEFFTRFSSRFPSVEKFNLEQNDSGDVEISSLSLKYLSICVSDESRTENIRLDVPNIVKFDLDGRCYIPFLSLGDTVSKDWICNVQLKIGHHVIGDSWIVKLRQLMTELSSSRLSLLIIFIWHHKVLTERTPCFPIPVVENLWVVDMTKDPLFLSCHPKFFTNSVPAKTQCFVGKGLTCYVISY